MSESVITKKAIAQSLIELTKQKSFDKISVADITKACLLNRQTFYYHFQDKYELLDWIYYNETFMPLLEDISFENWNDRLAELLRKMKADQYFYMNTIQCSENYFQEYLLKILITLFQEAIEMLDKDRKLSGDDKHFSACFYAHGLNGLIIDWASAGMKEPVEEMDQRIRRLVRSIEEVAHRHYLLEVSC